MNNSNQEPSQGYRQQVSGMNCPVCQKFIPISIEQLLHDGSIFCPHCGLQLSINRTESRHALDALAKVEDAMKKVKETETFRK